MKTKASMAFTYTGHGITVLADSLTERQVALALIDMGRELIGRAEAERGEPTNGKLAGTNGGHPRPRFTLDPPAGGPDPMPLGETGTGEDDGIVCNEPVESPLDVACTKCGSQPGSPCVSSKRGEVGRDMTGFHKERKEDYAEVKSEAVA